MTREYIKSKILQIANQLFEDEIHPDDLLYLIIAESTRAITFINAIEDEFEIEIDDDDIDAEFFSSFDEIIFRLGNYIKICP